MEGINWLAVIVAAASTLVVGFVWYSPKVFGAIWMREIGISSDGPKPDSSVMTKMFIGSFVFGLIAAWFLAWSGTAVHGGAEFATFKHGAFHSFQLGLFVGLPILATNAMYEMRGWKYIVIVTGFWVVCFAIMGGILSVWQ